MKDNKEIKEYKQYGAYGLIIKDNKILLIKKNGGPYDGKLDLPGGTIEFHERPEDTLIRELKEEVGIDVKKHELFDVDSVTFLWKVNNVIVDGHHVGVFYKVLDYSNEVKETMKIDDRNDDSLGAKYYEIANLKESDLSLIAALELKKLGYEI